MSRKKPPAPRTPDLDDERRAQLRNELSLTADLAAAVSRRFREQYLSGAYHNEMPGLVGKSKEDPDPVQPWLPTETRFGRAYALGLATSYLFEGVHGPQFVLQLRVGTETAVARGMKKDSLKDLRNWFAGVCLEMIQTAHEVRTLLGARNISRLGAVSREDFFHWFNVTHGKMPRLTAGAGKRKSRSMAIGDSIANANAGGRSSGCITAFVTKPESGPPFFALGAGHVISHFSTLPIDTSVLRLGAKEPEDIGLYTHPTDFQFVPGQLVHCDAALVTLKEDKRPLNRIGYRGRNFRLAGALTIDRDQLGRGPLGLGIVGRDKKVTAAKLTGVDVSQAFLDKRDNVYHYEDLVVMAPAEGASSGQKRAIVSAGDSGSLVFRQHDAVDDESDSTLLGLGLVIGGQIGQGSTALGYCIRLDHVFNSLGVEVTK